MIRTTCIRRDHQARGFTYVGLLIAIALIGIGLATAAPIWQRAAERQRLQELDWIGGEFVRAVASYYNGTPGVVVKTFPPTFQSMVVDDRFMFIRRHLRRVYLNPFTAKADWEPIIAPPGGIRGVRVMITVRGKLEERIYAFTPPP